MKDCTGKEITEEWLYHLGVPEEQIEELAENSAVCVPTMMPYITAFFMPRAKGDRPDVIPDGCVNFAFLGQFADTPRDTVFTTEYSVRTAMEAVYGLLGVDRGIPEVWGSVYDIRELSKQQCEADGRQISSGNRISGSESHQKTSAPLHQGNCDRENLTRLRCTERRNVILIKQKMCNISIICATASENQI